MDAVSVLPSLEEVRVEVSEDGGRSYRQILVQEYNFSPVGATYQREERRFNLRLAPLLVHEQRLLTEVLGEMFCESD